MAQYGSLDICQAVAQYSPARKPSLNQQKRKLATQGLPQCSSGGTGKTVNNVVNDGAVPQIVSTMFRSSYIQVTLQIALSLTVSAVVNLITMHLFLSGDVELNPGPKEGHLTTKDLRIILKALWSARSKWFHIGIELHVDVGDLDAIRVNNVRNVDQCLTDMIIKWLQLNLRESPPDWKSILSALRSSIVGREDLAKAIEEDHLEDGANDFKSIEEVQGLNDDQKEKLEDTFIRESERIRLKFHAFFRRFCRSLEQYKIEDLVGCLKMFQHVRESASQKSIAPNRKYREMVESIKDYDDVKRIIEECSTFIDCGPVEYMIDDLGMDKHKEELAEYRKLFEQYIWRRTYKYSFETTKHCDNYTKLIVKVESDYDKHCMAEIKQIQAILSIILDVYPWTLKVASIEEGCIRLVFLIPRSVQEAVFPLILEQERFLSELGIIRISCGDYHFPRDQDPIINDDDSSHFGDPSSGVDCISKNERSQQVTKDDGDTVSESGVGTSIQSEVTQTDYTNDPLGLYNTKQLSSSISEIILGIKQMSNADCQFEVSAYMHNNISTQSMLRDESGDLYTDNKQESMTAGTSADCFDDLDNIQFVLTKDKRLLKSIRRGKLDRVRQMTENEENLRGVMSSHYCPTHYAARWGVVSILKYFIEEKEFSHSQRGRLSQTPLHVAAQYGQFEAVKYLITKQIADPCNQDALQRTSLHYACVGGNLDVIGFILNEIRRYCDSESPAYEKSKCENTPLHFAAKLGHLDVICFFVSKLNYNLHTIGENGKTILHVAAENGHKHVVQYLVDKRCNPLLVDAHGDTVLHLAAANGHLEVASTLALDKQFNFTRCRNYHNWSPLHVAALNGHKNVVEMFIHKAKWNLHSLGWKLRTPLHVSAQNGHFQLVQYLHSQSTILNELLIKDRTNCTPAQLAQKNGYQETMHFLNYTCLNHYIDIGAIHVLKAFISSFQCDLTATIPSIATPLHMAAALGKIDFVKCFINELNCSPMCAGIKQRTPLHYAALNGHLNIVEYLCVVKKCNPVCKDAVGHTPIHTAVSGGHLKVVKFFIKKLKCDPNVLGFDNKTPLHMAAESGRLDIIKYLIEKQHCDPEGLKINQVSPLHIASFNGHLKAVQYLTIYSDPTHGDRENNTPIHLAAYRGHLSVIEFFLSWPENIDICGYRNRTLLHYAAMFDTNLPLIKDLIEKHKCDPLLLDMDGSTPLHLASLNGCLDIVKYLCSKCNLESISTNNPPVLIASRKGHLDIVRFFVSELNCILCDPATILHSATKCGHLNIVKYLIEEENYNPSCRDEHNLTPLNNATIFGHLNIVKYLALKQRCDPTCSKNDFSYTSIHLAVVCDHLEIVKFFISDLNYDPNIQCSHLETTPLQVAAAHGHLNIVQYLIIEEDSDVLLGNAKFNTALHVAVAEGHLNVVKFMIAQCLLQPLDLIEGWYRRNPVHTAAEFGHISILKYFIDEQKCDFQISDSQGDNLLHFSASQGHLNIVQYLTLDLNFDPNLADAYNNTALHEAARNGHFEVVKFLVETLHCPTCVRGSCQMTPLEWAFFKGHFGIVRYLSK